MYDGMMPRYERAVAGNASSASQVREIAFVGNGPVAGDVAAAVDGADWVVRFNKAAGFGGRTGRRVDDLFLVNCGGQAHEWARDAAFWRSAQVAATRCVSLPVARHDRGSGMKAFARAAPADRDGVNFERDMRRRLRRHPCRVRTMPETLRLSAISALARIEPRPDAPIWPSTGFLALYWYDRLSDADTRMVLFGYGFSGWPGHPWARERAWVMDRIRAGRMRLADGATRRAAA